MSSLRAAFTKAKAPAAQLPTTDPTAFVTAARAVASEVRMDAPGFDSVVTQLATKYPTSTVAKAFGTTKECRAIS